MINSVDVTYEEVKVGLLEKIIRNIRRLLLVKPTFKPNFENSNSSTKEILLMNMINDFRIYNELPALKIELYNCCQAFNRSTEWIAAGNRDIMMMTHPRFEKQFKNMGLEYVDDMIIEDFITDYKSCFQYILQRGMYKGTILNPKHLYIGVSIEYHQGDYPTFCLVFSR